MILKEILDLYNFRYYRSELQIESKKYDTNIVRIYLNDGSCSDYRYIEFGVYDFGNEDKEYLYKKFINEKILKSKVNEIYFDDELNVFCIWLGI